MDIYITAGTSWENRATEDAGNGRDGRPSVCTFSQQASGLVHFDQFGQHICCFFPGLETLNSKTIYRHLSSSTRVRCSSLRYPGMIRASHILEKDIKVTKQSQQGKICSPNLYCCISSFRISLPTQLKFICLAFVYFFPKGLSTIARPLLPLHQPDCHPHSFQQHFEEAADHAASLRVFVCQLLRC